MDSLLIKPPGAYLRYQDLPGEDPPLVWIHGLGCASSADFASVAADSALNRHRSLLVDLLGHGYSDGPEAFGYTLDEHALTVARLLDHLSVSQCAVFGHSMGGSVAISLAALRPDLVSRLLIAEGNLDPGGGFVSAGIAEQTEAEFLAAGRGSLLERIAPFGATRVATFQVSSPLGLYRSAVGLVEGTQPSMRERLYAFEIPRAYLFGDQALPDPDTEELAAHGVQVLVVPESGHDMPFDNPAGLAGMIAQAR